MSRVDDLIAEHCPDGVPFKTMGEIGELVRGNGMPKTDFTEAGIGAIHYGQIYTYYGTSATKTVSFVAPETAVRLAKVDPGDVIITNTSENVDDVGKAVAWLGEDQIVTGGHATVFKHDQDPRFIAYWLQSPSFQRQKKKLATGTKVIDVSAKQLATVEVPVPALAIQREIVSILDKMERLEAELEAELEYRGRQYAYYRSSLLSFPERERVRWATLSDLGSIVTGRTPKSSEQSAWGDEVDFVTPSDIKNGMRTVVHPARRLSAAGAATMSRVVIPSGALLVTCIGADMGKTVINANDCVPNQQINAIVVADESVDTGYMFHVLTSMRDALRRQGEQGGGTMPLINKSDFSRIQVPIPDLAEQMRIASALDKFDVLVNGMTEGLPAEIRARRQQYEYYRDKLLTFEEVAA